MDISTSPENHENEDSLDLGKVKVESYESKVKQNNPTELLVFPLFRFRVNMDLRTPLLCLPYFKFFLIEPK